MERRRATAAATVAALVAPGAFAAAIDAAGAPTPAALAHARVIRAEVDARYASTPGRRLRITEASSTGVVASLTLVSDLLPEPRVVPAWNGVYFSICPTRAFCPYPARSAAVEVAAFRPRRMAVELALRTFAETTADLVVVALPTLLPVYLVLERTDAPTPSRAQVALLTGRPGVRTPAITALVEAATSTWLFEPAGLAPVSDTEETMILARVAVP
jgi:hypothetical protein